jgi:hypothetical protein
MFVTSNSKLSLDQSTLCKKGSFLEENEGVETARGQRGGWMEKYIRTWLSFACPAVGVKIPLRVTPLKVPRVRLSLKNC